jgi:hypothetical protein
MEKPKKPYAGYSRDEQYAAVREAKSLDELREMWDAWEAIGYSRAGLLYAAVLERMQELGAVLERDELAAIEAAREARERGKTLPPITGRIGG